MRVDKKTEYSLLLIEQKKNVMKSVMIDFFFHDYVENKTNI